MVNPGPCVRGLIHRFDRTSAWCSNGCGWRADGRSQYRLPVPPPADVVDVTVPRREVEHADR